jgi:Uma2 family endonuclease
MAHALQRPIDLIDYLAMDEASSLRHEYVGGYVHAMTGGSMRHNRIALNIASALLQRLRGSPCTVFINDMKLRVRAADSVYYPDVFVHCGSGVAGDLRVVDDATLIVEVSSPSTAGTDRREKLIAYRQLPSLRSYWVVSQDERGVEVHARSDAGAWTLALLSDDDDTLHAPGVPGAALRLADLYVGTDLAA